MPSTDVALDRWMETAKKIVRQNGSIVDAALLMSYRHPNGFDKISFNYTNLNEPTTRLHIWWPAGCDPLDRDEMQKDSDIHDHPWSFVSTVITGEIENRTFILRPTGESKSGLGNFSRQIIYIRDRRNPADVVRTVRVADCNIDSAEIEHVYPGQSYQMDPTTLHRLVPNTNAVSSTLVLQQPLSRRYSTVIRPRNERLEISSRAMKFSTSELRTILGNFLDHIR